MRITVFGCGYLGATHAACMAELGHEVLGVEAHPERLALLQKGELPFYEPGLDTMIRRTLDAENLRFTESAQEAGEFGDVHFICVGTPQRAGSLAADVSDVFNAVEALAPHLRPGAVVVGKSTVPVGTAAALERRIGEIIAPTSVELAWNPEFLREGFAISDTLAPDRLVFGVRSESTVSSLREVYAQAISQGSPVIITDLATAELTKVSANAFLATKISFINAISDVCEAAGADIVDLADAIGLDDRIGRKFLSAGIGFGGGCLPKDIRAFMHRAGELGVEGSMKFLHEVDAINLGRRTKVVSMAIELLGGTASGSRIGVLGAAFKPESDDVRDSPALWIAAQLQSAGAEVTVYDPKAMESAAAVYPALGFAADAITACDQADIVLHLTEWPEFRSIDPDQLRAAVSVPRILDGRNALDALEWRRRGWEFRGMGRR